MEIQHPAMAFSVLKPVCNDVIKQPLKDHILKLTELLRTVSPSALQVLHALPLYPLELHLQNLQLSSEIKRYLVDCVKEILQRTHVHDLKKFLQLYMLLFFQIYDHKTSSLVGDVPEELKLSVMECVITLLKRTSSDIICEFYSRKYAPKLGQGIYIAIQMAQWEKLRSLRLASLECVMILTQVHIDADKDDIVFRHQVGDVIMFFLPGIISGLQRISTADEKQGHPITVLAVKAWGEIIAVVMEDTDAADASLHLDMQCRVNPSPTVVQEDPLEIKWKDCSRESMLQNLQEKSRTTQWYRAAAEKLAVSTKAIGMVQRHSHWKVRMALMSSCHVLLSRCCRNMEPSIMYLIEIIIMLSEDENEKIAAAAANGLKLYSEKCEAQYGKSLLEILEDNFYNLVTKLPRILHGTDDLQQLAALQLLAGYIKLLGFKRMPHLLSSASHLNRLMLTLIQAFELDYSFVSLLEDYSLRDLKATDVQPQMLPWKQFRHVTDYSILKKMEDVCCILGRYGDLNIMSYHLLDMFHRYPHNRKEIIFLLNEILCGGAHREDTNLESIIGNVLRIYLDSSNWYVSLSAGTLVNDFQEEMSITIGQAQTNVIQACLLVEGVGKMAKVLGSRFDQFLLKTLYFVLERAGSANGLVAEAGITAIWDISEACGYGRDVTGLVQANADYFSYHVTCRLRSVEQNPGVIDVLNIVMKYSTMDVLPCLEEIVKDVLVQSCDVLRDRNAVSFLRVFYTFVLSVRRWIKDNNCDDSKEVETLELVERTVKTSQVVNDIIDYHCCKRQSEDFKHEVDGSDSDSEKCTGSGEVNSDREKKLPLFVEMTVSVLKRCIHFLPSKRREQKLLVLAILQEGLLILETWENELLPIVHAIWSPFVNRFTETSDHLVVNCSFGLLCVLAKTAKDFIRSRTLKQVLPPLCQILTKSCLESKKKDKGSSYRFTQLFKLQKELLSKMGDLAVHLNLQEREIDHVLTAAAPYLSSLQPLPLQHCCMKLFQKLSVVNQDTVWLKLVNMWHPVHQLNPPVDGLKIIKVTENNMHGQEEFKKNVEEILGFLDIKSYREELGYLSNVNTGYQNHLE